MRTDLTNLFVDRGDLSGLLSSCQSSIVTDFNVFSTCDHILILSHLDEFHNDEANKYRAKSGILLAAAFLAAGSRHDTVRELQNLGRLKSENFDGQALDFLEKVVQNLNENITALYAASQAEDSQEVRRIAHDLKAISAMAGASQPQEMAMAIQSCVDSSDGTTVATVLETLPAAHENVTQACTLLTQRLNANSWCAPALPWAAKTSV